MKLAIAYYRVSTARQGKSGLGLDAQQTAVRNYCTMNGYMLLQEMEEVRSTRKHRPRLQTAFEICKERNATLVVARLDRLGRDVEEIAHNVKLPVEIIVTDNPHANRFTIHILAAVAEEQRRTISENTKSALQAAKRKGIELGKNGKVLAQMNKQAANDFAKQLAPTIQQLAIEGFTSSRTIAKELNNRNIPTFKEYGQWHGTSVLNLLKRIEVIIKSNKPGTHSK